MATTTIRIIEGAAGCGKTAQALDACRQCVAEHGFDAALVLVPTGRVGDLIRGRLWHEGLSGLFDFRVLTFGGLADALLLANHVPVAAVNDLQQQYLVGRAVAEMTGAELGPLAAQRDRLGLIASVAGLINEMKAAGVSPEALGEALAKGRADAIERAAVRAYARYQKLLQDRNLYDAAGMLWQAQEALAEGKTRPFERTRLVIADGFSDFTTTQLRVLARLAAIAEETIITLTCEPGEDRPELQRVPARTRAALEEHLGPSTGSGPSVGTIERVTPTSSTRRPSPGMGAMRPCGSCVRRGRGRRSGLRRGRSSGCSRGRMGRRGRQTSPSSRVAWMPIRGRCAGCSMSTTCRCSWRGASRRRGGRA